MAMAMANRFFSERTRKGPWQWEEDLRLISYVGLNGEGHWDFLAKAAGLRRSGRSCRLRWINYLRPDVKHSDITAEEERIIIHLHARWGNRWSRIAQCLPGRTDNAIKNYWRTKKKKKLQHHAQCELVNDVESFVPNPESQTEGGIDKHEQECNPPHVTPIENRCEEAQQQQNSVEMTCTSPTIPIPNCEELYDYDSAYSFSVESLNTMSLFDLYGENNNIPECYLYNAACCSSPRALSDGDICLDELWNLDGLIGTRIPQHSRSASEGAPYTQNE